MNPIQELILGPVMTELVKIQLQLVTIQSQNRAILAQGAAIMATLAELEHELQEANAVTNEIASDVDDLLARQAAGGMTAAEEDQLKADIVALKDRLKGVAAKHTPTPQP